MIVAMAVAFGAADLDGRPADPLRFNTGFAEGRPSVLVFLALFLTALSCAALDTARLARRTAPEDPGLRHAARYFGVSMVICFGYVVCNAPAVVLASLGSHALDGVGVLGSLFGAVATVLTGYGVTGAAVGAWLRERRDVRTLRPLWRLAVKDVDAGLALDPGGTGLCLTNVRFTLHRRVVEIPDGMRVLRAWSSAGAAEAVGRHVEAAVPPLPAAERQAVVTAAVLRDAGLRLRAARAHAARTRQERPVPPAAPVVRLPGDAAPGPRRAARHRPGGHRRRFPEGGALPHRPRGRGTPPLPARRSAGAGTALGSRTESRAVAGRPPVRPLAGRMRCRTAPGAGPPTPRPAPSTAPPGRLTGRHGCRSSPRILPMRRVREGGARARTWSVISRSSCSCGSAAGSGGARVRTAARASWS
ncbi:DUF6545 domain-containing protein [Streptomyces bikiniensis]|uniref:DUF6545 domain-containing protein n=1 Tax=Streptomyces bikiniensis TaxID=1896 RepID=A0ABW8CX89_STRBI